MAAVCVSQFDHPPYRPGDVIVEATPLIYALWPEATDSYCFCCFKELKDLAAIDIIKCPGCLKLNYCSCECQEFDWLNFHMHRECEIYAKFGQEKMLQTKMTVAYLRCLIVFLKRSEDMTKACSVLGGKERCFIDLVEHESDFKANESFIDQLQEVIFFFEETGLEFDHDDFEQVIFRFHINSFTIRDSLMNRIGHGLCVETSIFDHSCAPNAALINNGNIIQIRAIKEIAGNEPVRISYCDVLQNRSDRQRELKDNYYFTCNCTRCIKNDPLDEKTCDDINLLLHRFLQTDSNLDSVDRAAICGVIVSLMEKVCGKYAPHLTAVKVEYYLLCLADNIKPKFTYDEVMDDLMITHGPDHQFFRHFEAPPAVINLDVLQVFNNLVDKVKKLFI